MSDTVTLIRRRRVLAATVGALGAAGVAGCSSLSNVPGGGGNGSGADSGGNGGGGTGAVNGCGMLSGSFVTHDTGATVFPLDFEYPGSFEGTWEYPYGEEQPTLSASINRGKEITPQDGDVMMKFDVAAASTDRQTFYKRWGDRESLTTTQLNGESVEFVVETLSGMEGGGTNGVQSRGVLPYRPGGASEPAYFETILAVTVGLMRTDFTGVTSNCFENQRTVARKTVESLSFNDQTTFDQVVEP